MAGAAYNKFYLPVQYWTNCLGGSVSTGTWKAALTNATMTSTFTLYTGWNSSESSGINGYSSGGATLTLTTSNITGTQTVQWTATNPTWTGTSATSTAGFTFRYAVFYEATSSVNLAWFDYGGALTIYPGDTLTLSSTSATSILFTMA